MGIQPRVVSTANNTDLVYRCPADVRSSLVFNLANKGVVEATVSLLAVSSEQAGVREVTVTNVGSNYTTVPAVTIGLPDNAPTIAKRDANVATAHAVMEVETAAVNSAGAGYRAGNVYTATTADGDQFDITVTDVDGSGAIQTLTVATRGSMATITAATATVEAGEDAPTQATLNLTFRVKSVVVDDEGGFYLTDPAVTFASGAALATASIDVTDLNDSFTLMPAVALAANSLLKTDIVHLSAGDAVYVLADTNDVVVTPYGVVSTAI